MSKVNWAEILGTAPGAVLDDSPPASRDDFIPSGMTLTDWVDGLPRKRSAVIDLVMDLSGSTHMVHKDITELETRSLEGVMESVGATGAESILIATHALSEVMQWSGHYSVLATVKGNRAFVPNGGTPMPLMYDELIARNLGLRNALAATGKSITSVNHLLITDFGDTQRDKTALQAAMNRYAEYVRKFNVKITAVLPPCFDENAVTFIRELGGQIHYLAGCNPKKLLEIVVATVSQVSIDLNLAKR